MTRKKDSIKLNRLHLIKRRRMQKYHARKFIRTYFKYAAKENMWMFAYACSLTISCGFGARWNLLCKANSPFADNL